MGGEFGNNCDFINGIKYGPIMAPMSAKIIATIAILLAVSIRNVISIIGGALLTG
jgi:hypothetical protein